MESTGRTLASVLFTSVLAVSTLVVSTDTNAALLHAVRAQQTFAAFPTCNNGGMARDNSTGAGVSVNCEIPAVSGFSAVSGNADAYGTYGLLGTRAQGSATDGDGRDYTILGSASFTDTLIVTSGSKAFGNIELQFSISAFQIDDQLLLQDGDLLVFNELLIQIEQERPGPDLRSQFIDLAPLQPSQIPGVPPPSPTLVSMPFTVDFGEPFELTVRLLSEVRCMLCTGQWSGTANAFNTAVLDVIASADGDPLLVQSSLGNVYANVGVVPVPAALWMLLSGFAVLATRRKFR